MPWSSIKVHCVNPVALCAPQELSVQFRSVAQSCLTLHDPMNRSTPGLPVLCLFLLFMGFSRQEYWSGLPFPSPVDHILSGLSTMTLPSWVAPKAWLGFIELDEAVVLVWSDWLVFCQYGFSVSALWCPLATLTFLLGFLLPWRGVSLHGCSSKAHKSAFLRLKNWSICIKSSHLCQS